ncbi:hypothetical protein A2125_01105 [Candidatus Woesebacteria bacterium GWB1_43_5]|uniref:Uncharacterized protein n=1 Tax=Candidatus Woesebacteria bacterium GWB1_43_5 TaxID=1802474 RepID=A0A1F7WUB2_9BACT|nr:MAG: hypothetical protein A2125_01105 [Candidatus Woesebacteria bacterium GWB1_43_5]
MDSTLAGRIPIVHKLPVNGRKTTLVYLVAAIAVVLGGVGTGWFLSGGGSLNLFGSGAPAAPGAKVAEMEAGITDESTFTDTAEGMLEKGALRGDGTHTLVRNGGESKNVALTSTVIDLDSYTGKKVQIWGQTLVAQKAPWLMDVGKLKVIQ